MVNAVPSTMTPIVSELPQSVREMPVVGPTAEFLRGFTSPIGLASAAAWPAMTARMALGGAALGGLGYGAEELGAPKGTGTVAQVGGTLLGPMVSPILEKAALRGAKALPGAVREAAPVAREALVAGERGSVPLGPRVPEEPIPAAPPGEPPVPPKPPTGAPVEPTKPPGPQRIIANKEATLKHPGIEAKIPIVRRIASVPFPSVTMPREVLVGITSRGAARASVLNEIRMSEMQAVREFKAAWAEETPKFVGPAEHAPFATNPSNYAQNPEEYIASQRLTNAGDNLAGIQRKNLQYMRDEWGIEIPEFPTKPGGFFLPNVKARLPKGKAVDEIVSTYTGGGLSTKFGTAKQRYWESFAERATKTDFVPETDLDRLLAYHDESLAKMAGNETFRTAVPGKTRIEAVEELHPGWAAAKDNMARTVQNLKNRIDTAWSQMGRYGYTEQKLQSALNQTERRYETLAQRYALLEDAGVDMGPEYKNLLIRAQEVEMRGRTLTRMLEGANGRKIASQMRLGDLQAQLKELEPQLADLRARYANVNLDPYVMNRKTFRYHTPEESAAIDGVLLGRIPLVQPLINLINEIKATVFGGDFSPLAIQEALGVLSHPDVALRNARRLIADSVTGRGLEAAALENPAKMQRYVEALGRSPSQLGREFVQPGQGPGRLPFGVGKKWTGFNQKLLDMTEYFRYLSWDADSSFLQKLGGKTQVMADAEAANTGSKIIPALNPAERGASRAQAELELVPVISTSFIGGPAGLIKDATTGLGKLGFSTEVSPLLRWQALSGREQLALLRLTTMTGSLATISVASYMLSGFSPEEAAKISLTPGGRFLSLSTSEKGRGGFIPLGGPIRSLIMGLAPRYEAGKGIGGWVPFAGATDYIQYKIGPSLSTIKGFVRNKDWEDKTIVHGEFPENVLSALWYAAEQHIPLSAGTVSEQIRTGEATNLRDLGIEATAQIAGVNYYPGSAYDKLENLSVQIKDKHFRDLDVEAKRDFLLNPEAQAAWNEYLAEQEGRGHPEAKKLDTQVRETETQLKQMIDAGQATGVQVRNTYSVFQAARRTLNKELYGDIKQRKAKSTEEAIALEYWDVELQRGANGLDDWPTFFAQREAVLQAHAGEVPVETMKTWLRDYEVKLWVDPTVRAKVNEMLDAEAVMDAYYKIPAYLGVSVEEGEQVSRVLAEASDMVSNGMAANRKIAVLKIAKRENLPTKIKLKALNPIANPRRKIFRGRDENRDAFLWYSDIPLDVW
jgi:hypothetical protein